MYSFSIAAATNYHKFIISLMTQVRIPISLAGFSALGPIRPKLECQPGWALIHRLWQRICFQVCSVCWWNSAISSCISTGCQSGVGVIFIFQKLSTLTGSWPPFSIFKARKGGSSPSHSLNISDLSHHIALIGSSALLF